MSVLFPVLPLLLLGEMSPLHGQGIRAAEKKIDCGFAAIVPSPGGTDLSHAGMTATGLSSYELVCLRLEEQRKAKELCAPHGDFSTIGP